MTTPISALGLKNLAGQLHDAHKEFVDPEIHGYTERERLFLVKLRKIEAQLRGIEDRGGYVITQAEKDEFDGLHNAEAIRLSRPEPEPEPAMEFSYSVRNCGKCGAVLGLVLPLGDLRDFDPTDEAATLHAQWHEKLAAL